MGSRLRKLCAHCGEKVAYIAAPDVSAERYVRGLTTTESHGASAVFEVTGAPVIAPFDATIDTIPAWDPAFLGWQYLCRCPAGRARPARESAAELRAAVTAALAQGRRTC